MSALDQILDLFSVRRGPEPDVVHEERMRIRDFLSAGTFVPQCDSWLSGHSSQFSAELGAAGWIGMTWPVRLGGREVAPDVRYAVIEELLAAGAPVAAHWFADRQVGPSLLRHGSVEIQQRFLPDMAAGRVFFCIGMSESQAGSDLGSVRTRARPVARGWRVTGSKIWISHADRAHFMLALVRTGAPDESSSTALTQVIIDMRDPGVTVRPITTLDGSAHFCEVFLDDVAVEDAMVVGRPGSGWGQVLAELAFERSGPERLLSTFPLVRDFLRASTRLDDGRAGDLGHLIGRLATLRAMSERVNAQLGRGDAPGPAAAVVKDLGTRFENETVQIVRRWIGESTPDMHRMLRDAQAHAPNFTLRGGTNEILRNIEVFSVS